MEAHRGGILSRIRNPDLYSTPTIYIACTPSDPASPYNLPFKPLTINTPHERLYKAHRRPVTRTES